MEDSMEDVPLDEVPEHSCSVRAKVDDECVYLSTITNWLVVWIIVYIYN